MDSIVDNIREELRRNADQGRKKSGERYFKEKVELYGIQSSLVKKIARTHYHSITDKGKEKIFAHCEDLLSSGIMEEAFVACIWSFNVRKQYKPDDFKVFERWVNKYISNWATCDTLCNHTVGTFIEMFPEYLEDMKNWAHSENRWVKRASAVSLIIPARKGLYLDKIFEIAGILHSDRDDMVQKGYGWMLKSASHSKQKEVFEYILLKKATMPRTALRYAIEKMPSEMKAMAMAR